MDRIHIAAFDLFSSIRARHATEIEELSLLVSAMALAHGLDDAERDAATKLASMALNALGNASEAMLRPVKAATAAALALADPPSPTRH
jgi:hypothetical protein